MPLLRAEPHLFPEDLFCDQDQFTCSDRCWHVSRTLPRQEKALARHLLNRQVPFYLPTISRRIRIRDRAFNSHTPLFSGYVFVFANNDERLIELTSRRIAQSLAVPDQPGLWRDLTQIEQLITSGAAITPEDRMVPGTKVTIRSGAFRGMEGTFVRSASGNRFVIQINFIQRGASVLLDDFAVEQV
jgi:transcription antitermination factor NusG